MKDDRMTRKLLAGAALGALFGLAAVWILVNRPDSRSMRLRAGRHIEKAESISMAEVLGLGMSVMRVARQAGELVRKV